MAIYTTGGAGKYTGEPPKTFSKWKWFFIPWPVRSINNKIIFGPMYIKLEHHFVKKPNVINGIDDIIIRHYATKKEMFCEKLKGEL